MSTKWLDLTGLSYFWSKIKAYTGNFACNAATATKLKGPKHSYTTAASQAKDWLRIANATRSQIADKPLHLQFVLKASSSATGVGYYQSWYVDLEVYGANAGCRAFGNVNVPFSQCRVLYENTAASVDSSTRPCVDLYLNYVLTAGSVLEIEEIYNEGFEFVADGQLAVSVVPSGYENRAVGVFALGVQYSQAAQYSYLNCSNLSADTTLVATNDTHRYRILNCTGTITLTLPSVNSSHVWFYIKNNGTGVVTLHPASASVMFDNVSEDIALQPGEFIRLACQSNNHYSIVDDGRWMSQKADKATTLAGYGINDAKIANGTITLGSNSITPITSHQTLPTLSKTDSGSGNAVTAISVSNHAITVTKGSTFALNNAVVHNTGNEAVSGLKSFSNSYSYNTYYPDRKVSAIHVVSPDITKGQTPTSTSLNYTSLIFLDSNAEDSNYANRLGAVEYTYPFTDSEHNGRITLKCYKAVPAQGDASSLSADLVVGFDLSGNKFATAPSTSASRNEATDILTRDWIPSDARIMHTSGTETVAGTKTFSDDATFSSAVIMAGNIRKNADNDELYVCGGSGGSNARGAYLRLKGVSASSNAGLFFLCTAKVSDSYANLNGYPNGTLTWNGQNIQTSSDERLKTPLSAVPDDVLDAWGDVQWGRFQYLDAVAQKGASARLHLGLIAQRVKAVFEARGLDACAYGILCYDVVDEIWMVRYAEAAAMEACYQRRRADRLEVRIAALEEKLS